MSKIGRRKISCFRDLLFSAQKGFRPPQKEYSGASGSQKAPQMEPKIDTFWDLWNLDFCCYLLGLDHFGGSQNDSKMDSVFEGLLGASFLRSRGPKKRPKAYFSRFWADLGLPWGPLLEPFWRFLGGLNFHAFLVHFWAGVGGMCGAPGACIFCRIMAKVPSRCYPHAGVRRI